MSLLPRHVSRRCWRYGQYAAVAGMVFLLVSLYNSNSSSLNVLQQDEELAKKVVSSSGETIDKNIITNSNDLKIVLEKQKKKMSLTASFSFDLYDDSGKEQDGFDPFIKFRDLPKKDWHDYEQMAADGKRTGPGEQGSPVALPSDAETKKKQDAIYRVNGFDGMASDLILFNRSLKDIRHVGCMKKRYVSKLPPVAVVVPFHNEHWSTLLRTVHTVIDRSPMEVLYEIVLVDDFSSKEFLKQQLDDYLKSTFRKDFVRVVRTTKREGLIRAREIGAKAVSEAAKIIVVLDSHSEPQYNWIPPLVEPIALDYRTVVCPYVDVIDCDTFEYRAQDEGGRGSFDWEFSYKRLPLREKDKLDPTEPFPSPVMAGGYFAMSKKWFWELGGYDEGLDIWGGEQYELSFKVWQCHGKMIDAPCSRVGHIYRCKHTPFPNPGVGDFISRNFKRVAEVWMDEFKDVLYKRKPHIKDVDAGDMSKQLEVRQRLKCKPFSWFIKEVMPDQERFYPAVEPADGAMGELRNLAANKCVDTQFRGKDERFELRKCIKDDANSGGEQTLRYSWWKDIRPKDRSMCFDVSTSVDHAPIVLYPCHGMQGNQEWKYRFDSQQLHHPISNLCLDCDADRGELFMSSCNQHARSQKWNWLGLNKTIVETWK